MKNFFSTKKNVTIAFVAVLVLATGLRFWGLGTLDVQHDHAINSYRALGWLDYLGDKQTSPIIWFKDLPWWTHLSFHDHPPLSFFIQHITFNLFSDTGLAAHLPFVLGGLATVALIFFIVKKESSDREALLAALLYAISSYAIWSSRTGYLEGIETAFIMATVYCFFRFFKSGAHRDALLWGLMLALALLTKYTSVFLIPAALVALLIWQRDRLKQWQTWIAPLLTLLLLIPVIIYNLFTFMTRGHFDAALSSMVGMHPTDFGGIAERGVNANIIANVTGIWLTILANVSIPLLGLLLAALLAIFFVRKKQNNPFITIVLIHAGFIVLLFTFSGTQTRFLSIIVPFLTIILARGIVIFYTAARNNARYLLIAITSSIIAYELFFAINTNLTRKPVGVAPITFAPDRFYDHGYERLDQFLRENAYGPLPPRKKFSTLADTYLPLDFKQGRALLLDERIDWFAKTWYVRRYQHYYQMPLLDLTYLAQLLKRHDLNGDILVSLQALGVKELWFIQVNDAVATNDEDADYALGINTLAKNLEGFGIHPTIIKDYQSRDAFMVYHFFLQDGSH